MVTSSVPSERSQVASARLSEPAQPGYTPPEMVLEWRRLTGLVNNGGS
jgi:hypothetical protein